MTTLKLGLTAFILPSLISCATQTPIVRTEYPLIPETLLQVPPYPAKPAAPRTNEDMYLWRVELEQWACEGLYRWSESVRFATMGQQDVEISEECKAPD